MVAVDDHVEGAGVQGVDDRQSAGPLVDERLGVAPGGVRREGDRIDLGDCEPVSPNRPKGGIDDCGGGLPVVLGALGEEGFDSGPTTCPLTGAEASIWARTSGAASRIAPGVSSPMSRR